MKPFEIEIRFVGSDPESFYVPSARTRVASDNVPRRGETLIGLPDILGDEMEDEDGWREILLNDLDPEPIVAKVEHRVIHEGERPFLLGSLTTVVIETPDPGVDVRRRILASSQRIWQVDQVVPEDDEEAARSAERQRVVMEHARILVEQAQTAASSTTTGPCLADE